MGQLLRLRSSSVGSSHSSADHYSCLPTPLRYGFPEHHLAFGFMAAGCAATLQSTAAACTVLGCVPCAEQALSLDGRCTCICICCTCDCACKNQDGREDGNFWKRVPMLELVLSMDMVFSRGVGRCDGSRESVRR